MSDDAGHDVGDDDDDVDDDDDTADVDGDDGNNVFLRFSLSPPPLILSFRGRQSPKTPKKYFLHTSLNEKMSVWRLLRNPFLSNFRHHSRR